MSAAQITMSLAEWQEQHNRGEALERQVADLTAKLEQAELGADDAVARRLSEALVHALEIVQFAIANYEPRMWPGWPHEALVKFADLLPGLPGVSPSMREQGNDLRLFARNAAEWEDARANGTQHAKLYEENAARGLRIPE